MRSSMFLNAVGFFSLSLLAASLTAGEQARLVGITFSERRDRGGPTSTLFAEFDDGTQKALSENTAGSPLDAQVSKDGRYVVVNEFRDTDGDGQITFADRSTAIIMPTAGRDGRLVLEHASTFSFSPDGKSLAFRSEKSGKGEVWVVDVASGLERQVTTGANWAGHVHWSPDGKWIAFYSKDEVGSYASVVKPDGSDYTRLSKSVGNGWGLNWGTHGELVFSMEVERGRRRFYASRPDETEVKDITGSTVQCENRNRVGWPLKDLGPLAEFHR